MNSKQKRDLELQRIAANTAAFNLLNKAFFQQPTKEPANDDQP